MSQPPFPRRRSSTKRASPAERAHIKQVAFPESWRLQPLVLVRLRHACQKATTLVGVVIQTPQGPFACTSRPVQAERTNTCGKNLVTLGTIDVTANDVQFRASKLSIAEIKAARRAAKAEGKRTGEVASRQYWEAPVVQGHAIMAFCQVCDMALDLDLGELVSVVKSADSRTIDVTV